jgi:hypothetical protein
MNAQKSKLAQWTCLLLVLPVGLSGYAQGTLIDSNTRNGSFEDGVLSPWGGYFTVAQDSSFASQDSWFAVVQNSVVFSPFIGQNLSADPNSGLLFLLTFDARIGDPGYVLVNTRMSGRSLGGTALSAVVTPITVPPLSASSWQSYQYELQMPQAWGNSGFTFSVGFSRTSVDGVLRTAYLDNIVLQQIPEPSALALLALGGSLLAAFRIRHSKS